MGIGHIGKTEKGIKKKGRKERDIPLTRSKHRDRWIYLVLEFAQRII